MALSDLAVRNAKPKDKAYKLFDGGGLHLLVNPNGSRIWRLAYRFVGKPKQISFGPCPTVSLAEAREKRDEAKKLLLSGQDPSAARKIEKVQAAVAEGNTFGVVAAEYIARLEMRDSAPATLSKNKWLLEGLAGPALGHRPIAEITPFEILSVLQQVERSGRRETARRLRSAIQRRNSRRSVLAPLAISAKTFSRPEVLRCSVWLPNVYPSVDTRAYLLIMRT